MPRYLTMLIPTSTAHTSRQTTLARCARPVQLMISTVSEISIWEGCRVAGWRSMSPSQAPMKKMTYGHGSGFGAETHPAGVAALL